MLRDIKGIMGFVIERRKGFEAAVALTLVGGIILVGVERLAGLGSYVIPIAAIAAGGGWLFVALLGKVIHGRRGNILFRVDNKIVIEVANLSHSEIEKVIEKVEAVKDR